MRKKFIIQRKQQMSEKRNMKKVSWLVSGGMVVFCMMIFGIAGAEPHKVGVSAGYGRSTDNIDAFRFGIQKPFSAQWFESRIGTLSGYFELSYNRWEHSNDTTHGAGFSPVFVYYFQPVGHKRMTPYIEGGIGVACIDEYKIAGRNLSSNFQFEDRIGIGVLLNRLDIKIGYMHYSNADLKSPNDGIDIWLGTLAWRF
jgi:lipid A 3-O-deacylase